VKFRVDENLPVELVADLRAAGHEAQTAREEGLAGAPDPTLIEKVRSEARVLLTMDKGIANVRAYPRNATHASSCSVPALRVGAQS